MLIVFKSNHPNAINLDNVTHFYVRDETLYFRDLNNYVFSIDCSTNTVANSVFKQIVSAIVAGEKVFHLST